MWHLLTIGESSALGPTAGVRLGDGPSCGDGPSPNHPLGVWWRGNEPKHPANGQPGMWLTHALGIGLLHIVLLSIPFFSVLRHGLDTCYL